MPVLSPERSLEPSSSTVERNNRGVDFGNSNAKLGSEDEIQRLTEIERITNGKPSHFDMDAAFCARMHAAIAAGLESAPTSVVATPGTKNPIYVSDLTARYRRSFNER
jgi:hypothetical protein